MQQSERDCRDDAEIPTVVRSSEYYQPSKYYQNEDYARLCFKLGQNNKTPEKLRLSLQDKTRQGQSFYVRRIRPPAGV